MLGVIHSSTVLMHVFSHERAYRKDKVWIFKPGLFPRVLGKNFLLTGKFLLFNQKTVIPLQPVTAELELTTSCFPGHLALAH